MGKYKICVYAICKNEEKFVERWVKSMSEADDIYVLDTGSTDGTVEKLKALGVHVNQKVITPWRFDVARNESLKLIPDDMDFCCCIDIDENFLPGWREVLEKNLSSSTSRVRYKYIWNFNADGSPGITFFADKIHKNKCFDWEHPVHETLRQIDNKDTEVLTIDNLVLEHHADDKKSRSNYLPLLELSVKEDPSSDRNMHYLGREYFFHQKYQECIKILKQHLAMKNSVWAEERCSSCRIIASAYENLKNYKMAGQYYMLAVAECPHVREPYFDIAKYHYRHGKYLQCINYILSAINIKNRELNYMSQPECWDYSIYDILALSFYNIKDYLNAYKYGKIALDMHPNDQRLINNYICYMNAIKKQIMNNNQTPNSQ